MRFGKDVITNEPGSHLTPGTRHRNRLSRAVRAKERREKGAEYLEEQAEKLRHRDEPLDTSVTMLPRETDDANVEYKLRLKDPSQARLQQLVRSPLVPDRSDSVHRDVQVVCR